MILLALWVISKKEIAKKERTFNHKVHEESPYKGYHNIMTEDGLSKIIIGLAIKVHNNLGLWRCKAWCWI